MNNIRERVDPEMVQFAISQDIYIQRLKKMAFEFVSKSPHSIIVDLKTGEIKSSVNPRLQEVLNEISNAIKSREQSIRFK